MKTPSTTQPKLVSVPAIVGIDGLSVGEQVALAYVHANPNCTNSALARQLGLSVRGAESTLARLRKTGLIRQLGHGRGRCHQLTFDLESHIPCGKTEMPKSHMGCGGAPTGGLAKAQTQLLGEVPGTAPAKHELTFDQFVDFHSNQFQICLGRGELAGALEHLKVLRERLEELDARLPSDTARAEIAHALKVVTLEENRVKGFMWVASHSESMTREDAQLMTVKVKQADEAQLARLTVYFQSNPVVGDAAAVLALLEAKP